MTSPFARLAKNLPPHAQRLALAGCAPCVREAYRRAWEAEKRAAIEKRIAEAEAK